MYTSYQEVFDQQIVESQANGKFIVQLMVEPLIADHT